MEKEGITFKTNIWVGRDYPVLHLQKEFDMVILCGGATQARDLPVPGRTLKGLHFAVEYLTQQNKRNQGIEIEGEEIVAKGKNVVVVGSGDTGLDCVGTAIRQGAENVYHLGRSGKTAKKRGDNATWPICPMKFESKEVYEEGGIREYSVRVTAFSGEKGQVNKLHGIKIDESQNEVPGSEFEIECDLVLFAMGFLHPEHENMLKDLGVELDSRGNVKTDKNNKTDRKSVV